MHLRGTRALALSQGLSSCPARQKSATGHGARLTLPAKSRNSPATALETTWACLRNQRPDSGASGKVNGGRRPTANSMPVRSDRRLQGCPITRSHHSK